MTITLLKEKVRSVINWVDLLKGMQTFNKTNSTPDRAYQAMIRLHGRTNGRSTQWIAKQYAKKANAIVSGEMVHGVLGSLSSQDIQNVVSKISEQGFYVFHEIVPKEICEKIEKFAFSVPAMIEDDDQQEYQIKRALFDPSNPISKTYKIPEQELIVNPLVQDLMADESIRAIVQSYVKADPVLASVNAWFSPVYKPNVDGAASAQNYHFDMSRCRWLNFFLYLNDVDINQGPHCFIKGSHRPSDRAGQHLLKRGYVRIPDNDVYQVFGKDKEVQFTAKRGTIIVEDTIGFHKGKPPQQGYRSIFELVYAVSLFGGHYHRYKLPDQLTPKLREAIKKTPHTYQRYY